MSKTPRQPLDIENSSGPEVFGTAALSMIPEETEEEKKAEDQKEKDQGIADLARAFSPTPIPPTT